MGRKSYSRQAMQKFIASTNIVVPTVIPQQSELNVLDFAIPEEIVVKRFVVNVNPGVTGTTEADHGSCLVSLVQSDNGVSAAGDPLDPNRLIRSASGTPGSPVNLDETITMRKLAGSGIHLYIANLSTSNESYGAKVTLHYLEV